MNLTKIIFLSLIAFSVTYGSIEAKEKKYKNGDFYSGDMKKGKPDGQGKMVFADGAVYEGLWSDGKIIGDGKLQDESGTFEGVFIPVYENDKLISVKPVKGKSESSIASMEGEWDENNVFTGKMLVGETIFNGIIENEVFKEGRLDLGEDSFIEGIMLLTPQFEGELRNANLPDSYLLDYPAIYSGTFKNGKFIGHLSGNKYNAYINKFEIDVKEDGGQSGKFSLANGGSYSGEMKNKKYNGEGELTLKKGTYKGEWQDGKLYNGEIKEQDEFNTTYNYVVENGKPSYIFEDGEVLVLDNVLNGKNTLYTVVAQRKKEKKILDQFHKYWQGNTVKFFGKLVANPEEEAKMKAFWNLDASYFEGYAQLILSEDGNATFIVDIAPTEKAFNEGRPRAIQVVGFCEEMNRDIKGKWSIDDNRILLDGKKYGLRISPDSKSVNYSGSFDAKMVLQNK